MRKWTYCALSRRFPVITGIFLLMFSNVLHAQVYPLDYGQSVNGFQDQFDGTTLNDAWEVVNVGTNPNVYTLDGNGALHVGRADGNPDHLLLTGVPYNPDNQEVLARIRVTNFGPVDYVSGGIGVAVSRDAGTEFSRGIDLHLREGYSDSDIGLVGKHFRFLDDMRVWGPGLDFEWQQGARYWIRLAHTNSNGIPTVYGKVWSADGLTAEPADWTATWNYTSTPVRTGFAGIAAGGYGAQSEFECDYFLLKAAGLPPITVAPTASAPAILEISPADKLSYVATNQPITFQVQSTVGVSATGISLSINGVDKTASLVIGGTAGSRTVSCGGSFEWNKIYTATARVISADGRNSTVTWTFDTFKQDNFSFEAEDFNFNGGLYEDNPVVGMNSPYLNRVGLPLIDEYDAFDSVAGHAYRLEDYRGYWTGIQETVGTHAIPFSEPLRQVYWEAQNAGDPLAIDFAVGWIDVGEWLNYTRTFPAGTYLMYARLASGNPTGFLARMDWVTSDATKSNQTTAPFGTLAGPSTGGYDSYIFAPLSDAFGKPLVQRIAAGVKTLRFTQIALGCDLNYFTFAPVTVTGPLTPYILTATPANDSTDIGPAADVSATIVDRDTKVVASSVQMFFDGTTNVTPALVKTATTDGLQVTYSLTNANPANGLHSVMLVYVDDAVPANKFTNTWQFTVTGSYPPPVISVTPANLDFGNVQVGSSSFLSFVVQNTGGGMLSGQANVSSPFRIVSGSPYNLTTNQSTTVVVCYSPTSVEIDNQNIEFTGAGGASRQVSGLAEFFPQDYGQFVNGFQDQFDGTTLDSAWEVVNTGAKSNVYTLNGNGALHVSAADGYINHLLLTGVAYDHDNQEVLARIRVNSFGTGNEPCGGIGVAVTRDAGGDFSRGINLHFRDYTEYSQEGMVTGKHLRLLDDQRAWGAVLGFNWELGTRYWIRVAHTNTGTPTVYGKIWPADGMAMEPADWMVTWTYPNTPARTGYAGLAADGYGAQSEFECDYFLLKAAGLPMVAAVPTASPPVISGISPADKLSYVATNAAVSFQAQCTAGISITGISLSINGVNKTASLVIGGSAMSRTVTCAGTFEYNKIYTVAANVISADGQNSSVTWTFDTFRQDNFSFEAEDFNFDGGQYVDNPVIGTYSPYMGRIGTPYIDEYDPSNQGNHDYRLEDYRGYWTGIQESVGTRVTPLSEPLRQVYWEAQNASDPLAIDFAVGWIDVGEWFNYTRTFPAGAYQMYARLSSGDSTGFLARMDWVTSSSTTSNQTTAPFGSLVGPSTGSYDAFAFSPLSDAFGKPLAQRIDAGVKTLRFTQMKLGCELNYFTFVPVTLTSPLTPYVLTVLPFNNSTNASPITDISATITDRDTKVVSSSVQMFFDATNDVTSALVKTTTTDGLKVIYSSTNIHPANSLHTVTLIYADDATPANKFTNTWHYTVNASYAVLPATDVRTPGSGQTSGFTSRLAQTSVGIANTTQFSEDILAGVYPIILSGTDTNSQVINYAGPSIGGNFGNDTLFSVGFDLSSVPDYFEANGNNFATETITYLELKRGSYWFGVNSDDGFRLTEGTVIDNTGVHIGTVVGEYNSGRGASDTIFEFIVPADGLYPFRLTYENGGGGFEVEWFSVDPVTGIKTLINDPNTPSSIKAYRFCTDVAPAIAVTPGIQDFGSIERGTTSDLEFVVQNTGGGMLSGSASVPSPFNIVSGSPYSLMKDQSANVIVRYNPSMVGSDSQTVLFTGGGDASRQVTGSAHLPPPGTVAFTSSSFSVSENEGSIQVKVSRTGGVYGEASVNYATVNGTAIAGTDYVSTTGTLTWTDGDGEDKSFTVMINDNSLCQGNMTFTAQLSSASGAALGDPGSTTVTIVDNEVNIAGAVQTKAGACVAGVTVEFGANCPSVVTSPAGVFCQTVQSGWNGKITPSKSDDSPSNAGVTTADITLIRRHILGLARLNTPYKLIAADVNADKDVTTADITFIRRIILGVATEFPAGLWKFVSSDFIFTNLANPWSPPFNTSPSCETLSGTVPNVDFVAIKLGDVNEDWTGHVTGADRVAVNKTLNAGKSMTLRSPILTLGARTVARGGRVSVPICVTNFTGITSMQFTLVWDPALLEFVSVESYNLRDLSGANFNTRLNGRLACSWEDPGTVGITMNDGVSLFTVQFQTVGTSGRTSAVAFADEPTLREFTVESVVTPAVWQDEKMTSPAVQPRCTAILPEAEGGVRFVFVGVPGETYQIEYCTSVMPANWISLTSCTADSEGKFEYVGNVQAGASGQFYRAVLRPVTTPKSGEL